jgi:hypothetical protein
MITLLNRWRIEKMVKCPLDADSTKIEFQCDSRSGKNHKLFYCTRVKEHGGLHHAHGVANECCHTWSDD